MNRVIFLWASFLLLNYSCDVSDSSPNFEGIYRGTYSLTQYISTDSSSTKQCSIFIEFTDRAYHYESDDFFILPGGSGKYSIDSQAIVFTDTVGHQADIDPKQLLNNKFNYRINGNNLSLNQNDLVYKFSRKIDLIKQN